MTPWTKSSHSANGNCCVEVAWTKSSHSAGAACCVEIAGGADGAVLVRDSKDPDGPVLTFTPAEWAAFVAGVNDGEFDQPA